MCLGYRWLQTGYLRADEFGVNALPGCAEGHLLRDDALLGVVLLRLHLVAPRIPLRHPLFPDLGQPLPGTHTLVACHAIRSARSLRATQTYSTRMIRLWWECCMF